MPQASQVGMGEYLFAGMFGAMQWYDMIWAVVALYKGGIWLAAYSVRASKMMISDENDNLLLVHIITGSC